MNGGAFIYIYIYLQCTLNETRLLTAGGTSLEAMHK